MASGVRPLQSPKPEETPLVGGRGASWTRAGGCRSSGGIERAPPGSKYEMHCPGELSWTRC